MIGNNVNTITKFKILKVYHIGGLYIQKLEHQLFPTVEI